MIETTPRKGRSSYDRVAEKSRPALERQRLPTRPKGPRWVTVVGVGAAYGFAYLIGWMVVQLL
jgi:hypothetical protein